ncbi:MAG: hypothetical protein QGI83_17740 [Candidatus Latescibacteria bacterium]|jgi:hypothetical protein|nr:hypothetical protein [Candidatus Latescibacterota bacterium]
MLLKVSIRVDLGRDLGQNFGSLFEAADAVGNVVAGAGYLGAHNTDVRSDRRILNFFIKPKTPVAEPSVERLPRANDDAGVYLHTFTDRVLARSRGGARDRKVRYWDEAQGKWVVDVATPGLAIHLGNRVLATSPRGVAFDGRSVLELGPDQGSIGETYYANGVFVYREHDRKRSPFLNRLVACPWDPIEDGSIDLQRAEILELRTDTEFAYGCGQLGRKVLITTNTGGIYEFSAEGWRVLLEPDSNTSFQIYSAINYYDRLLFGQYPTGEQWEYDGNDLRLLKGWPPVMNGVSKRAREAQTAAIYGGELYVGVWPWAEVWRYDRNTAAWTFVHRMFTHPELHEDPTHPYETEMRQLDGVWNDWGQRVTSLVPYREALYVGTSSKGGSPYEPKFQFLADGRWEDYGAIYRYTVPGHLSVYTEWCDGPTAFDFVLTGDRMTVSQDGKEIGSADLPPGLAEQIAAADVAWGSGVYGAFRGEILDHSLSN